MQTIGENLEEKLQKQFNYVHSPLTNQRKLFDKLKTACMLSKMNMKIKNHKITGILLHLHRSGEPVGDYWAKPIVHNDRLYFKFPNKKLGLIDASHVDVFGEDIHNV